MSDEPIFSTLEIDTIGEIMNISMGSAATAASTLLDTKTVITTPIVNVVATEDFDIALMEPAIAVEIKYVEGISGSNILILRQTDCKLILAQMMQTELPEDYVLDEMATSAICELMNQMMGSSATVLSCFLGRAINISTPTVITIDEFENFKNNHMPQESHILTIKFTLSIEGLVESEFISAMQLDLAREIISVSLNFGSDDDVEAESPPAEQPSPAGADPMFTAQQPHMMNDPMYASQQPPAMNDPMFAPQQPHMMNDPMHAAQQPPMMPQIPLDQQQTAQMPGAGAYPPPGYGYPQYNPYAAPPGYPPMMQGYPYPPQQQPMQAPHHSASDPILIKEYDYGDFSGGAAPKDAPGNLDLVMSVPVTVTVELGRTKRKIKEILEFGQGTIVELDKQAGSQVDVIVNGQLVAHGDVVVVDDNFSIRITEILKGRDSLTML